MEFALDANIVVGLLTLIALEVVLGIDNLVFIAILADRLPEHQRDRARLIGLSLALIMRLGLLASISWLVGLTAPLVTLFGFAFAGRDLILLGGGLFLLFKATVEIHERLEGGDHGKGGTGGHAKFWAVIAQILVLDAVFSLDSVITAVGMVKELWVMMVAVVVAMAVMLLASKPLTAFVNRHPTVIMLCLGFLLMIGLSLIAEGFHFEIPKGYLYAAIGFSVLIEAFNQIGSANRRQRIESAPLRQRTMDALLRLTGGDPGTARPAPGADAGTAMTGFAPGERAMIEGVIRLGARTVRAIMTPRRDVAWIDSAAGEDEIRRVLSDHGHSRYLVAEGELDRLKGVVMTRALLADMLAGRPMDLAGHVQAPLVVQDRLPVARLVEVLKTSPARLAVVVDEHGNIEGVVTPTDLLAAIAGDLVEAEDADPVAETQPDGSLALDGAMPIDAAAKALGLATLGPGGYATVAGFVLDRFGRVPAEGESVEWEGYRFTVEALDGHRIARVLAKRIAD